ncbi:MAG: hypothetical protein RR205_01680 [Oscillospiraceae bacterium]
MKKFISIILAVGIIGGTMVTGFAYNNTNDEDIIPTNIMIGALFYSNGSWYYNDNGEHFVLTGFQKIDGDRYCFSKTGEMLKGWQTIDHKQYYFNELGVMAAGQVTIDGLLYDFDMNGVFKKEAGKSSSTAYKYISYEDDDLVKIVRRYERSQKEQNKMNKASYPEYLTAEKLQVKLDNARENLDNAQKAYDSMAAISPNRATRYLLDEVRKYDNLVDFYSDLQDEYEGNSEY